MPKQKTQKNEGMRVLMLEAENVKRIKAIKITPKENVVVISGKNGQGKTSATDSIWYALGGKNAIQKKPIREGKKKAKTKIILGSKIHDELNYIIERSWTDNEHSYLEITTEQGKGFGSPQKLLDGLRGEISFDPLEFARAAQKEQRRLLMEAIKIKPDWKKLEKITGNDWSHYGDFISGIDAAYDSSFRERTEINREVKELGIKIEDIEIPNEYEKAEPIAISDLFEKQRKINTLIETEDMIAKTKIEIEQLEQRLQELTKKRGDFHKAGYRANNIEVIDKQIANAEEINRYAQLRKTRQNMENEHEQQQIKASDRTDRLEELKQLKTALVSKSKLPIDGLDFSEDGVTYKGIPFEQISDSEKLKVSMAIAMALNPKIRVIRITDGSLLDSDSMTVIQEMAKDNDFQVWIEVVDESGKVGICIEDGEVKSIDGVLIEK